MTDKFAPFLHDVSFEDVELGVLASGSFNQEALDLIELPFAIPDRFSNSVLKRRAEFAAGRLMCYLLQEAMGLPKEQISVAPSRAPVWPQDQSGSISHSGSHVVAWMVKSAEVSLGLDIESIAAGKSLEAIKSTVLSPNEVALAGHDNEAMTAMFSAKEALFKAIYPSVGRFFGFGAAEAVAASQDRITLQLTAPLGERFAAGDRFDVLRESVAPGVRTRLCVPMSCTSK